VWRVTSLLWTLEVITLTLAFIYFFGGRSWLSHFNFPVCLFLVAVPWLYPLERFLVEHLTQLNVAATVELLSWCGVTAVSHANVIEISTGVVGIDQACSGIRSFQATLMISLFLGEVHRLAVRRRLGLVVLGIVLAFAFNVGRTFLLTCVAASKGVAAVATWHDPAGVTILVAGFLSLWLLALWLRSVASASSPASVASVPAGKSPDSSAPDSKLDVRCSTFNVPLALPSSPSSSLSAGGEGRGEVALPPSPIRCSNFCFPWPVKPFLTSLGSLSVFQRFSIFLIAWLLAVELGTDLWYRLHERTPGSQPEWCLRRPVGNSYFKEVELSPFVLGEFRADQHIQWQWQEPGGARWQLFYFRWIPSRQLSRRVGAQRAKMHGPTTCLPQVGMTLESDLGEVVIPFAGSGLALHQYEFKSEGNRINVFYGIYEDQTGMEVLANRRISQASRITAALSGSRNYGQRFLEIAVIGLDGPQEARDALARELEKLIKIEKPTD
jgi:exosortase